jgi:hypothetical protein
MNKMILFLTSEKDKILNKKIQDLGNQKYNLEQQLRNLNKNL